MVDHWPWYVLIFAMINWVAVEKKWLWVEYLTKPGTMILLLIWVGINGGFSGPIRWFTLGLLLSFVGDIFLMLPGNLFLPGLISFLFAQVAYTIGFNIEGLLVNSQGLIFLLGIAACGAWIYLNMIICLERNCQPELKVPVLVYLLAISLMVYSAMMTGWRDPWMGLPAILAIVGASAFYASDAILACDRFIQAIPHGRTLNMMLYHVGQLGIMTGAVLMGLSI